MQVKPNLPEQIRELPCSAMGGYEPDVSARLAYQLGHRDARHAAADLAAAALSAAPAPQLVGWLTQAGNVVTPAAHREQDARLYGWKPVYLLSEASAAAPAQEPVMWQFRWTNPAGDTNVPPSMLEWQKVQPWSAIQTLEQRIEELRSFCYQGKHAYEVRALYASPLPQEVKALTEAARQALAFLEAEFPLVGPQQALSAKAVLRGALDARAIERELRGAQEGKALTSSQTK